jgi:S-adenosylmethionine:tRNA ribosyltransferase-isomerase
MNSLREIKIADYKYTLEDSKIAKYPLTNREDSKLLIYKEGEIYEKTYRNALEEIPENSLLVFNNTKVVEARLHFRTETGALVEIFYLEPLSDEIDSSLAMSTKDSIWIKCYIGNAKRWKTEKLIRTITINNKEIQVEVSNKERVSDYFHVLISWDSNDSIFSEILHAFGTIPLPPYLHRETEESDNLRYQTVFSSVKGSVAAPTAGLHFTDALISNFPQKNIQAEYLTLHVGAGTFKPVKSEMIGEHEMHGEYLVVSLATIKAIRTKYGKGKILCVGTTSVRTIESLYWFGVRLKKQSFTIGSIPVLNQWDAYELENEELSVEDAFDSLVNYLEENNLDKFLAKTKIMIAPGYVYKVVDAIFTNFHQPESTLLLLVSALIGSDWQKVYAYALSNNFRFLSYGDGSLLWKKSN